MNNKKLITMPLRIARLPHGDTVIQDANGVVVEDLHCLVQTVNLLHEFFEITLAATLDENIDSSERMFEIVNAFHPELFEQEVPEGETKQ